MACYFMFHFGNLAGRVFSRPWPAHDAGKGCTKCITDNFINPIVAEGGCWRIPMPVEIEPSQRHTGTRSPTQDPRKLQKNPRGKNTLQPAKPKTRKPKDLTTHLNQG